MNEQPYRQSGRSAPSQPLVTWLAQQYDSALASPAGPHGSSHHAAFGAPWAAAWDELGLMTADRWPPPAPAA